MTLNQWLTTTGLQYLALAVFTIVCGIISIYVYGRLPLIRDKLRQTSKSLNFKRLIGIAIISIGLISVYFAITRFVIFQNSISNTQGPNLNDMFEGMGLLFLAMILIMAGLFLAAPEFMDKIYDYQNRADRMQEQARLRRIEEEERSKEIGRLRARDEHNKKSS
jgi:hypothetical protein